MMSNAAARLSRSGVDYFIHVLQVRTRCYFFGLMIFAFKSTLQLGHLPGFVDVM